MGWWRRLRTGSAPGRRSWLPVPVPVLVLVCLGIISAGRPSTVLAHAVLVRSEPPQNARLTTPPKQVALFFSEPVSHSLSSVQVRNTTGQRRDQRDAGFTADPTEIVVGLPAMDAGFYTVTWITVSATDGHRLEGSFPFTMLTPDGSTPAGAPAPAATISNGATGIQPIDATLRWLLLLGLIGAVGGFGFAGLILYPAAGRLDGEDRRLGRGFALWLVGAVVPAAVLVVTIANAVELVHRAEVSGSLSAIGSLLQDKSGTYWIAREVLALSAGGLAWSLVRHETRPTGRLIPVLLGGGLLAGIGALLTMSLTSHAAAGSGVKWSVPADFLHLIGVSPWLGGLALLPILLRVRHRLDGDARSRFMGVALRRFSTMAVCCVGLVLLSGTFSALVQVPSWSALTDTAYGRALLVKLVFVVAILLLGLWNGARIARRFEQFAHRAHPATDQAGNRLARTAVIESLVGTLVIAATAVMVFLVPAKDAQTMAMARQVAPQAAPTASAYRDRAAAGDLTAALVVAPNHVGDNEFQIMLTGPDADQVQRVQLRFQAENQPVGGSAVVADADTGKPGMFIARAANFSFGGRWSVTVNVRRRGYDDVNGAFTVQVPGTAAMMGSSTAMSGMSPTGFPAHGITEQETWGILALAAAGLVIVVRTQPWNLRRHAADRRPGEQLDSWPK